MILRAVVIAAALAAPAFAEAPLTRTASGHLVTTVRIDATAAPFRIDTGAAGCTTPRNVAQAAHMVTISEQPALARAASVAIGVRPIGALKCAVSVDGVGVIGADVLSRFVVVFDAHGGELSLHGGAQHGQALVSPRARLVYAERLAGGRLGVPVTLNGARGTAVLDTGAATSTVNRRFAEAAGVQSGAATLGAFTLAGTTTDRINATVADLPAFATLGLEERPAMFLGLDRLADLRLVIDYPRGRIWFDPG